MADDHISKRSAVYTIAGMEHAVVRKDVVYLTTDAGPLTMDVYFPAELIARSPLPAVVLVAGYNDIGYEKMLGMKFKEMAMSISWGQLIAASGLVAIAYTNREPAADLDALLQHVRDNAAALGIDARSDRGMGLLGQRAAGAVGADEARTRLPEVRRAALRLHAGSRRRRRRRAGGGHASASPIRTRERHSTICGRICRCSLRGQARSSFPA